MSAPTTHRRDRTRWLLVACVAGLAGIAAAMVALEAIHPQVDDVDLSVDGLPPLVITEDRLCTRRADDPTSEDLRAEFEPGGRVSSDQVYRCPAAFDGLAVTYVGEVVGELLPRRGGAWAQVNDDAYALEVGPVLGHRERRGFNTGMSVWLPDGLHELIGAPGRYARRGDVILVRGTLLRADPDDGGGVTVRADELEVLAAAVELDAPLHGVQVTTAAVLAVLAAAALVWSRRERLR